MNDPAHATILLRAVMTKSDSIAKQSREPLFRGASGESCERAGNDETRDQCNPRRVYPTGIQISKPPFPVRESNVAS
jgi:hypothetical protein